MLTLHWWILSLNILHLYTTLIHSCICFAHVTFVPIIYRQSPSLFVMVNEEEEEEGEDVPIVEKEELSIPELIVSNEPSAPPQEEVEEEEVKSYDSGERKTEVALIRRSKKQLRKDLKKSSREDPIYINGQGDLVRYSKKQLREIKAAKQKKRKGEVLPLKVESPPPMTKMESPPLLTSSYDGPKGHGK